MGINEKYAEKVISGKATKAAPEAEEKPRTPVQEDTIKVDVPKSEAPVIKETSKAVKSLFSGMNVINWILAAGLVYAIYIAHQNKPEVVLSKHLDLLQDRFDDLKAEILGEVDRKIDAKFDELPWQVREFAKVKPRPGQSLIMYWEKGEGEIIEFDPARAKERDAQLQRK